MIYYFIISEKVEFFSTSYGLLNDSGLLVTRWNRELDVF
jgi:hypothetical protein